MPTPVNFVPNDPVAATAAAIASARADAIAAEAWRDVERRRTPPSGARSNWRSAGFWQAEVALTKYREHAEQARGAALGALVGAIGALVPTRGSPGFLRRLTQEPWRCPGLFDHWDTWRLPRSGNKTGLWNTVALAEPYVSAADMLDKLRLWTEKLAPYGLAVRHLPRDFLLHAPSDPNSQALLVGAPRLIWHDRGPRYYADHHTKDTTPCP